MFDFTCYCLVWVIHYIHTYVHRFVIWHFKLPVSPFTHTHTHTHTNTHTHTHTHAHPDILPEPGVVEAEEPGSAGQSPETGRNTRLFDRGRDREISQCCSRHSDPHGTVSIIIYLGSSGCPSTVEHLYKGNVLLQQYAKVLAWMKQLVSFIERCPLIRVSIVHCTIMLFHVALISVHLVMYLITTG